MWGRRKERQDDNRRNKSNAKHLRLRRPLLTAITDTSLAAAGSPLYLIRGQDAWLLDDEELGARRRAGDEARNTARLRNLNALTDTSTSHTSQCLIGVRSHLVTLHMSSW